MKSIKQWQKEIHALAKRKGFYDGIDFLDAGQHLPKWICLMHSELSEALEALRNNISWNAPHGIGEEFADCAIRIMDTCEFLGIDLEEQIMKKHRKNLKREHKHGKEF
jgi:NTP pyrophosphatase (non-canonical NTP hydrolase)